jgi:hypothetical protein
MGVGWFLPVMLFFIFLELLGNLFSLGIAPEGSRLPLYLPAGGCRCNRSRALDEGLIKGFV